MKHKNWFKRHLNWTLALGSVCGVALGLEGIIEFGMYGPVIAIFFANDVVVHAVIYIVLLLILIPITLWYLRQKGRYWYYVFLLLAPFGLFLLLALKNLSKAEPQQHGHIV